MGCRLAEPPWGGLCRRPRGVGRNRPRSWHVYLMFSLCLSYNSNEDESLSKFLKGYWKRIQVNQSDSDDGIFNHLVSIY